MYNNNIFYKKNHILILNQPRWAAIVFVIEFETPINRKDA
jgi:hypothetical protein